MTENPKVAPAWRVRWASRENDKRQRAFQVAADAWRRQSNDLGSMHTAATEFRGALRAPLGVAIDLRRGETVYVTLPAAQMIEAPHMTALPGVRFDLAPIPAESLGRPLPDVFKVMDAGTVVVTDRRVVFLGGRGKREWAYAKLVGLLHDQSSPFTLMHVVNRQKISGLYFPSASAPGFRFNLTLAIADANQQRQALVTHLGGMLAAHQRAQPVPPTLVTPAEAPATARVPGGKVSIGVVLLFALCAFAGIVAGPPAQTSPTSSSATRAVAPADAVTPPVVAQEVPSLATTSFSASPSPKPSPTMAVVKPKPRTSPTPRPKRTTASPAPKRVNLCGAPQNPYGYNFCGGSLIYSPASGVCGYFDCIDYFDNGVGYMIQCNDRMVSMSGGRRGSCSHHGGNRRPVYK